MPHSAIIFPGQGAQKIGMGADVAEAHDEARAVFQQANEILGFDLASICFEGPAEKLEQTDIQQPAIFVTSVAIWRAMAASGANMDRYTCTGGLSLGEYTALHLAGAFDFESALRLVRRRGELMQQASEAQPSGMLSLVGADKDAAEALCEKVRGQEVLAPANFNCPGQIVLSGHRAACERALESASEFGCKGVALPVAGAFHSPLMKPAAEALEPILTSTQIQAPTLPVYRNVDAAIHTDATGICDMLARQVTSPVLWQACIEKMIASGVERFVEVGPGRVLAGLMRKINRQMEVVSVNSADSVSSVVSVAGAG
ncbi:MAG: ACP S-malonyltransferase [Planctomycetota bacterium]|jgi:[acyl-carrier-protein] S-malonyltransferase